MVERAQKVTALLVSHALRRTPPGERILIAIELIGDGLAIEVTDPGQHDPAGGTEVGDLSRLTPRFEAEGGPNGHRVRTELLLADMAEPA